MRLAAAVVAGAILVGWGPIALAEEGAPAAPQGSSTLSRFLCKVNPFCRPPGKPQSCSDACDMNYDTCVAGWDGKRPTSCAAAAVRCKRACGPEEVTSRTIRRTPANCNDLCSVEFGECTKVRKADECATQTMKCRRACKEMQPEPAVAAAPAPVEERAQPPAAAPPPIGLRAPPPGAVPPRAAEHAPAAAPVGERQEPPAARTAKESVETAPAPPAAPPAGVVEAHGEPVPPVAAHATDAAPAAGVAPSAAVGATGAATATKAERPGFFTRVRCFLSPSCRGAETTAPRTCVEQCQADYDTCVGPGHNLPGSECATYMMRCRQKCKQAAKPE
jgi:hypothetical protein